MTVEWPKGKTCSEVLRESVEKSIAEDDYPTSTLVYILNGFELDEDSDFGEQAERDAILAVADRIEEEIKAAKNSSEFHFPVDPVDDSGKPWNIGDEIVVGSGEKSTINGLLWSGVRWYAEYALSGKCDLLYRALENCKRPDPDVLDADGEPIKVGDTVYSLLTTGKEPYGTSYVVREIYDGIKKILVKCGHDDDRCWWFYSYNLTHEYPDTQKKIDQDAEKTYIEYWGCKDISCEKCNVHVGKKPSEYYMVSDCNIAKCIDLVRRQRWLDAKLRRAK